MPELPEMENYKSLLHEKVLDQTITNLVINREKSINVSVEQFKQNVLNQKIIGVERRAKYLVFHLQSDSSLLLHLMLGGWMFYGKDEDKPNRTVQVQLSFGDYHLYFIGLRLGYLYLLSPEMVEKEFCKIGPEPLDPNFSLDTFLQLLKDRRGGLKTTLINQEFVAGIGNRYSDEILWQAKISPSMKTNELAHDQKVRLYNSIKFVLQQGIQYGGYMDEPFFRGDSQTGQYEKIMNVHNREGRTCPRCGTSIVKKEISARKTYYCPNCQQ